MSNFQNKLLSIPHFVVLADFYEGNLINDLAIGFVQEWVFN
jgi:hypothetical protein